MDKILLARKKYLTLALVGVILSVILFVFSWGTLNETTPTKPPEQLTPTQLPYKRIFPTAGFIDRTSDKIMIRGVAVSNFYKSSVKINENGDVLIKDTNSYQIVYLAYFKQFLISILSSPFDSIVAEAEKDFLTVLAISEDEICKLPVDMTTPQFANPEFAGNVYPMTFCSVK